MPSDTTPQRKTAKPVSATQMTWFDPGQAFREWDIARLRRLILEHLAQAFDEIALPDDAVCPECGMAIRLIVNPLGGQLAIWCTHCQWWADNRWLRDAGA